MSENDATVSNVAHTDHVAVKAGGNGRGATQFGVHLSDDVKWSVRKVQNHNIEISAVQYRLQLWILASLYCNPEKLCGSMPCILRATDRATWKVQRAWPLLIYLPFSALLYIS